MGPIGPCQRQVDLARAAEAPDVTDPDPRDVHVPDLSVEMRKGGDLPAAPFGAEGSQLMKPPWAQSRTKPGMRPSRRVMNTPTEMATVVKRPGTVTVGPSSAGSLKYIST